MSASFLTKGAYGLGLSFWVVFSLIVGQSLAGLALIYSPLSLNPSIEMTVLAALGYTLALTIALGVPVLITKKHVSRKTLGIGRLPAWSDIGLSVLSVLPYYIVSGVLLWLGMEVFKVIDPNVGQEIGFKNLTLGIEYTVAFITLVILAPLAEELLFRGYFFGKLSERANKWIALAVTALVFGSLHLVGFTDQGVVLQWGAAVDTFAMGLVAGSLRMITGSIWAGVILHAIKNSIAFYFLFVAPLSGAGM